MLSVLIPTYNHSCVSLVNEVVKQVQECGVDFELVVADDGSTDLGTIAQNSQIEQIPGCRLLVAPQNIGIARTRNKLMREARGNHLLFLDSDVFPVSHDFISKYLAEANRADVVVGGMTYRADGKVNALRLKYGLARETSTAAERRQRKHFFISANFMVNRKVADTIRFDETFDRYGHEDTLFGVSLQLAGMQTHHIDAPVYHDNDDTAEQYLEKTRVAIQSLTMHYDELKNYSRLACLYEKIYRLHLQNLVGSIYKYFRGPMERNLLSDNPSLRVLDLYKLSYLSRIIRL